jgi:hypothetical protein
MIHIMLKTYCITSHPHLTTLCSTIYPLSSLLSQNQKEGNKKGKKKQSFFYYLEKKRIDLFSFSFNTNFRVGYRSFIVRFEIGGLLLFDDPALVEEMRYCNRWTRSQKLLGSWKYIHAYIHPYIYIYTHSPRLPWSWSMNTFVRRRNVWRKIANGRGTGSDGDPMWLNASGRQVSVPAFPIPTFVLSSSTEETRSGRYYDEREEWKKRGH